MNKKEIFKKVAGIIAELNEQYDYLSQDPENLNELELELFAANADFLCDHITILRKLNQNSKPHSLEPEPSIPPVTISPETRIQEKPAENLIIEEESVNTIPEWKFEIKDESIQSFDFEEKAAQDLFDRPLTVEEIEVIEQKTQLKAQTGSDFEMKIEESIEPEPVKEEFSKTELSPEFKIFEENNLEEPATSTAGSEAEEKPRTINEILASQSSQGTVSSQFVHRQVKDLKSLINLNDKLLFVRDLFNGYSLAYSEAIEILNRFESFESADNFLKQNYSSKNNWAEKQIVADKFYEILNKRFSK
ncbi:MAG: hypothetical protein Q8S11_09730 [Daejeonella sp.]|uniref:hypothetical protein n=1 Tax=Daejeonella sp. TaxID=2805397 RepID=UPI002736F2A0|nr:hypothetical protein [Daejeonella sp.]MDP3468601.1 hypothetical protein [Daejeonella sp.]